MRHHAVHRLLRPLLVWRARHVSERMYMLILSVGVGAAAGLAAVLLKTSVRWGQTLLSGGMGSVLTSLVGVLLLGLIFNILNFENGRGLISITSFWQSVIRGAFLLVVIILQSRLTRTRGKVVQTPL